MSSTEVTFDAHTKPLILGFLTNNARLETVARLDIITNYLATAMANKQFTIPQIFFFDDDLIGFVIRKLICLLLESFVCAENASTIEQTAHGMLNMGDYLELFQTVLTVPYVKRKEHLLLIAAETLGIELPNTDGENQREEVTPDGAGRAGTKSRLEHESHKSTLLF